MRKIIFFGTGILLICLAGWGFYKIKKMHGNSSSEEPAARLSAPDLFNAFQKNEIVTNQKWLGKVLEISGTISTISETGNYISVNLAGTNGGGINCNVAKKDFPAAGLLYPGKPVTIKGICSGFLIDVNMIDCVVVK